MSKSARHSAKAAKSPSPGKRPPAPAPGPSPAQAVAVPNVTPSAIPTPPASPPRVLIAHSDAALLRLARESLEAFLDCEVRTTSSALTAFDRILQEPYRLLLIDLHLADLHGELLYDLITRVYPRVHPGALTAPPVLWLGTLQDLPRQDALTRDARTKALLLTPLNIQRLLDTASTLLPGKTASAPP